MSDKNHLLNFDKRSSKINKMWNMKSPKFCSLFSKRHPVNQDKYKILCSITTNSPPNHTHKQAHRRITHKPAVTLRNCSYAATYGFETSLKIIFVINRSSRCKLASLLFVVNSRMNRSLLRMSYKKSRIFNSTPGNLKIN